MTIHISVAKVNDFLAENKTHFNTLPLKRFSDLADVVTGSAWSPIIWRGGYRLAKNFDDCNLLVLDYDDGVPTVKQMAETMKKEGFRFAIGTTKSHQKEKKSGRKVKPACDRFRLIVQIDRPFAADSRQFKAQIGQIQRRYPGADPSCKDQARFFFPCREIAVMSDGQPLTLPKPPSIKALEKSEKRLIERQVNQARLGKLPRRVDRFLNNGESAARREDIFYSAACLARFGWKLADVERVITSAPFDKTGLTDADLNDIPRQIKNGYKAGRNEVNG